MINQDVKEKLERVDLERAKIDCAERVLNRASAYTTGSSNKLKNIAFDIFEQSLKNIGEIKW